MDELVARVHPADEHVHPRVWPKVLEGPREGGFFRYERARTHPLLSVHLADGSWVFGSVVVEARWAKKRAERERKGLESLIATFGASAVAVAAEP